MKKFIQLVFLCVVFLGNAQESKKKFKDRFNSSLVIASDVSYEFASETLQKSELIIKPEFSYKFGSKSKFVFRGQLYNEFNDNLEQGTPKEASVSGLSKRWFINDKTNLELREFYYYTRIQNTLRLTLGKQQIVWGETDGIKLLDVVNPQNFREFILDDFEDSRIPLWSLKAEFDIKDIGVQFVWIPDNTYHLTQDFNAPFFTKSLFKSSPNGVPVLFNDVKRPQRFLRDSDVGFKLSAFTKGWDISLNYFYYYEDLPVFDTSLNFIDETPSVVITPRYERNHLLGGTFNKVFGSSTFRGEFAYVFNQSFTSDNEDIFLGIEQSDVFKSALGIDYIKGEYVISTQLFNNWITSDIAPYNRGSIETSASLLLSKEMMNDSLKFEILWVHNLNNNDGYVTPSLSYWLTTNTQLLFNSHLFYGNEQYLFGQFSDRSRLSLGVIWGI